MNRALLTDAPQIDEDLREKISNRETNRCGTLADVLGFQYHELRRNQVVISMPADERTWQPWGIVHGGASVALAETCASIAAWLNVDDESKMVVGIEINANHLRPVRKGRVTGTATPIHIGATTHVWEVKLRNDDGKLTCISRCTLAVVPKSRV